jgi:uncharacterized protein YbaR (Trm112 family)
MAFDFLVCPHCKSSIIFFLPKKLGRKERGGREECEEIICCPTCNFNLEKDGCFKEK